MYIANLRVTYETASHDVLSRMTLDDDAKDQLYRALMAQDNIEEVVILQTCNRFEVFFSGKGEEKGMPQARKVILNTFGANTARYLFEDLWIDTIDHLFRLVSSIDSLIVGENQILAQVKEAFSYSNEHNYCGRVLRPTFQKALSVGKRVRTETKISKGKVSVASAAVDLTNDRVSIDGKKVVMVGSGRMASLLAEYLCTFDVGELVVIGRTPERLEQFCCEYPARPQPFDDLEGELVDADVMFSATSCPNVLISRDLIERVMDERSSALTVVDIAMPEDVDPTITDLPFVNFYGLDDLRDISDRNKVLRQEEATAVEAIITEEIETFMGSLQQFHLQNLLSHLNLYTEEIRRRELGKAVSMLGELDQKTEIVIEGLSKSLMKKFMHNFMTALREYPGDSEEMKSFVHIFIGSHLQPEEGGIPPAPTGHPEGVPMGHPAGIPMGHPAGIPMGVKEEEVEADVPRGSDEKA
ncbi:MAG: glutamyl-tRNA reductase [Thermoplasmata archaeon]|nr:glutamyl-tRNA reductase [Thermoplasmata archaeon]